MNYDNIRILIYILERERENDTVCIHCFHTYGYVYCCLYVYVCLEFDFTSRATCILDL